MSFEEKNTATYRKNDSGSRDATAASQTETDEKSLLSMIEERRADQFRRPSKLVSDVTGRLPIGRIEDVDENDQPELDHVLMRLGGNGF